MDVEISPEPSPEERAAILAALAQPRDGAEGYASRWRASALDDLRDGSLAEESGRDARVVEP